MSVADLDLALLRAMRTRGHAHPFEWAIGRFSRTGEHAACWFALGGLGAALDRNDRNRRGAWLRGLKIISAAYGVNYAVKLAVRRPRPVLADLPPLTPTVSRLSFPSAHATSSFAAACAYSRVLPALPLYAVAAAFAVSRPYLGVHYPSDVAAGALFGTLVARAWR